MPTDRSRSHRGRSEATCRRAAKIALVFVSIAASGGLSAATATSRIGGAVYTFNLEGDGQYHLRGYACNMGGDRSDQGNHPDVEVYLDAPLVYAVDGTVVPGSGRLLKSANASQPGSTGDEAVACDYIHDENPQQSFWSSMRFDVAFALADLAPIAGRTLYVFGAWHAPAPRLPRVVATQLSNSPITAPAPPLPALRVTCAGAPASAAPGTPITWTATAGGGTGVYTFDWSDSFGRAANTGSTVQWSPGGYFRGTVTAAVKVTDVNDMRGPGPSSTSATCQLPVVVPVSTAVLPSSRSVVVNTPATALMAAVVASATETVTGCRIAHDLQGTPAPAFSFQQTDQNGMPTGTPGAAFDLKPGSAANFVVSLTARSAVAPTEVGLTVSCADGSQSAKINGLNTLLFSASTSQPADVIAIAATPTNNGILTIPSGSPGAFSVAGVNVGATNGLLAIASDTSGKLSAGRLTICQTNPQGLCLATPSAAGVLLTLAQGEVATFSVFAVPNVAIPFDPANSRLFVDFRDVSGASRGRTSVAITTSQ